MLKRRPPAPRPPVTHLDELDLRPRTVVDSGLLHTLSHDGMASYVAGLESICTPGALVCVLVMCPAAGLGWGLTADELTNLFPGPAWVGTAVEPTQIQAVIDGEERHPAANLLTTRRA